VLFATLVCSGCSGLSGLTAAESERLDTFDAYWKALADDYPMFGKQVDWNELRQRYRGAVPFARAPHEFYHLLTGMLSELADPHVSFAVPPERFAADGLAPTSLLDVPSFRLLPIEGRLHVVQWPMDQAPSLPEGLPDGAIYPELWRVEGFPVVLPLVGNLLLGPPGSNVELQLRWRHGIVTRHVMSRPPAGAKRRVGPLGHLDAQGMPLEIRAHGPLPWLAIHTFDDELDLAKVDERITAATSSEALVLDLRSNLGGRWLRAQQLVERFLREPIDLVLVPAHPTSTWFGLIDVEMFVRSEWQPRGKPFPQPVLVLTSAMTGSAAEHAARVLQRYAGAVVIGERTAGAEAAIQEVPGPDGGVLRFGSMRIVDRTGVGLQAGGVVPDVSVRLSLDDLERLGPDDAVADWERRLRAATVRAIRGVPPP
jgi:C-terminal processing protease CtpA/Prc